MVGVLAAVLAGTLGGFAVATDPGGGAEVLTHDEIIDVPTSPGAPTREQLDATLFVPNSATRTPAPAVLLPHGFGGSKDSVADDATELAERGFVVLTYSARGFGDSTGQIALNDPDAEVADAGHLLDYLAAQDTVASDGDGDPRVAVTGASYAGALALLLAGTDDRVDAIAPVMTYNDLEQALVPNNARREPFDPTSAADVIAGPGGVFKRAWAGSLFLGGVGGGDDGPAATDGPATEPQPDAPEPGTDPADSDDPPVGGGNSPAAQPDPDNGMCGRFAQNVCDAYVDLAADGQLSDSTRQLLRRVSPRSVADDISAPTLLIQGQQDTLFGLEHADATARQIHAAGGEVQLAWYTGGHDGGGPGPNLRAQLGDWLAWQLDGPDPPEEDPFGAFRYDVQGSFAASGAPSVRTVEADGYPGVHGGQVRHRAVPLDGDEQTVTRPPGGAPAAISGLPGMSALTGRASLTNRLVADLPGQAASFSSAPMDEQVLVTGSSTIRLAVTRWRRRPARAIPPTTCGCSSSCTRSPPTARARCRDRPSHRCSSPTSTPASGASSPSACRRWCIRWSPANAWSWSSRPPTRRTATTPSLPRTRCRWRAASCRSRRCLGAAHRRTYRRPNWAGSPAYCCWPPGSPASGRCAGGARVRTTCATI